MELLDLTNHDPEEYEGKIVIWRQCEYIVGPYIGSGAERITHKTDQLRLATMFACAEDLASTRAWLHAQRVAGSPRGSPHTRHGFGEDRTRFDRNHSPGWLRRDADICRKCI